jgi:hypothetical protein
MYNPQIHPFSLQILDTCPNIERLLLNDCHQVTDIAVSNIGPKLEHLRELSLSKCTRIKAPTLASTSLRRLDLSWSRVQTPMIACPNLDTLDITGCPSIMRDSVEAAFECAGPHLRSFWCISVFCLDSPNTWIKLATACREGLKFLNVSNVPTFWPEDLHHLASTCVRLKRVYVTLCPHITFNTVASLQKTHTHLIISKDK